MRQARKSRKPEERTGPVVGFRKCPICKAGVHWECRGGEYADPKDRSKGVYLCDCGCEAAA